VRPDITTVAETSTVDKHERISAMSGQAASSRSSHVLDI